MEIDRKRIRCSADASILDVVHAANGSASLLDALVKAKSSDTLPHSCVGDYCNDRDEAIGKYRRIAGICEGSYAELTSILTRLVLDSKNIVEQNAQLSLATMTGDLGITDSEAAHLDVAITEIIGRSGCSARLANVIARAVEDGRLPHATLYEYYRDGEHAVDKYRALPNAGKKSVEELQEILGAEIERRFHSDTADTSYAMPDALQASIEDLVLYSDASVRLKNGIGAAAQTGRIPHSTLAEYAEKRPHSIAEYYDLPNLGKKSIQELQALLDEAILLIDSAASLTAKESPKVPTFEDKWPSLRSANLHDSPYDSCYMTLLAAREGVHWPEELTQWTVRDCVERDFWEFEASVKQVVQSVSVPGTCESAISILGWLKDLEPSGLAAYQSMGLLPHGLSSLSEREREILSRRYGLDGQPKETLEEIGSTQGVTRERIRQIEKKALKKLELPSAQAIFKELIRVNLHSFQRVFLGEDECGDFQEIATAKRFLPGELRLALDIAYSGSHGLKEFADEQYACIEGIYFPKHRKTQDFSSNLARLESDLQGFRLPRTVAYLSNHFNVASFALVVFAAQNPDYGFYKGYIHRGRLSQRKRRSMNMHKCALAHFGGIVEDFADLYGSYLHCFPEDQCSERDLRISIDMNPQLFIDMTDAGYWAVSRHIPIDGAGLPSRSSVPPQDPLAMRPPDGESLRSAVADLVEEMGPSALNAIKAKFMERFGEKWSENSVFPTLVESPYFVRMAPGIMGTRPMVSDPMSLKISPALLSATQVRIFVQAKRSGSVLNYPLWSPEVEYGWCHWGERHLPKALYCSLMDAVEPANWPLSEKARAEWKQKAEKIGRYEIQTDPKPLDSVLPTVRKVLSLAQYCQRHAQVSWMDLNRVLGSRQDDRNCLSYVAVLCQFGILKHHKDWQLPIPTNPDLAWNFINRTVCNDAIDSDWSMFTEDLAETSSAIPTWCSETEFRYLMSLLASKAQSSEKEQEPKSGLDQMLAELEEEELLAELSN